MKNNWSVVKRALMLLLALALVFSMCAVAYASGSEDIFDKASKLMSNLQGKILGISSAVCGVFLVIAACMWGFGNKQQSAAGWEWMKRIIVAYIAINSITAIITAIDNMSGITKT